ncbi:MAG: GNAT family N-acetyltransferase [Acidobacteriota bacterium]|nr:GNAT family N-acetyltransferase [Acidobacteriota bacterium]
MTSIFAPFTSLSDGVITLRRLHEDDALAVTRACQDVDLVRWTASITHPYLERNARAWLAGQPAKWEEGRTAGLAIVDAASQEFLGNFSIAQVDWSARRASVGYWVAAWARGRGVATRATLLGSAWALNVLGLNELGLETMIGNVASERVAQKSGYEFVNEELAVRVAIRPDRTFDLKHWRRRRADDDSSI